MRGMHAIFHLAVWLCDYVPLSMDCQLVMSFCMSSLGDSLIVLSRCSSTITQKTYPLSRNPSVLDFTIFQSLHMKFIVKSRDRAHVVHISHRVRHPIVRCPFLFASRDFLQCRKLKIVSFLISQLKITCIHSKQYYAYLWIRIGFKNQSALQKQHYLVLLQVLSPQQLRIYQKLYLPQLQQNICILSRLCGCVVLQLGGTWT